MRRGSTFVRRTLAGAVFFALLGTLAASPALGEEPAEDPPPMSGPAEAPVPDEDDEQDEAPTQDETEGPADAPARGESHEPADAPDSSETAAPEAELADSRLREIADAWLAGERDFDEVTDGAIRVEVVHEAGTTDVSAALAGAGATDIVTLASDLTVSTLPVEALLDAEQLPGVGYLRLPLVVAVPVNPDPVAGPPSPAPSGRPDPRPAPEEAAAGNVQSGWGGGDLLNSLGLSSWHSAGVTGTGIKVGIVDSFSKGAWDLASTWDDLPKAPAGIFCRKNGVTCSVWGSSTHGVSVAEAIHDVAPSAKLYLASVSTLEDLHAAVDYFAANGVKIISRSLGAQFDGPGDGTGPSAELLDYAVSKGMLWVNSAGNAGVDFEYGLGYYGGYWRGTWLDEDEDGYLDFVDPRGIEPTRNMIQSYCNVWLQGLRWSDWGESKTDYDLEVYAWNGAAWEKAGESVNSQKDNPSMKPIEIASAVSCSGDQSIGYKIKKVDDGNGTSGDVLELMTNGTMWDYVSNDGSAGQPFADTANPGGLSVGAIDFYSNVTAYSSRGPLNDGRTKPDLAAFTGYTAVTGQSYDYTFNGTSAATPVVSGLAALILQKHPELTPQQLGDYLRENATRDLGVAGPDNAYGAGGLRLPLLNTKAPKFTGTAKVGSTLTVSAGAWSASITPPAYQWLRNGKAISGATSNKYKMVLTDSGSRIGVKVTAAATGFKPESVTVTSASKVVGPSIKVKKLSYSGTLKVGKKLKAKLTGRSPATAKVAYQWYRNTKAIAGAKKSTYTLKKADAGKKITLRATLTAKYYAKTVKKYAKSTKVKKK